MKTIASRVWAIAALAAIGLTESGCEDPVDGAMPEEVFEPAEVLVQESEKVQDGYVNEVVLNDPAVRLLNRSGAPIANARVRFVAFEGGGSVSANDVYTDAQGYASVRWTLGPEPGRNRVRATMPGETQVRFIAWAMERGTPMSVTVEPGTTTFGSVGETEQLTAYAFDANGDQLPERFDWRSSDRNIATVDSTGLVRAVGIGTTGIVARTANGKADTAEVTVSQGVVSVSVTPAADTVAVGGESQLTAVARDANGSPVPSALVQWASRDPLIASVSATGLVTGLAPGSALITGTADGVADTALILVSGGGAPLFRSDWTTALGSSTDALRDTNQPHPWSSLLNNGNALRVVSGGTVGMPGNAVEILAVARTEGTGAYAANIRASELPVPAVGESRFYRWYMNVTVPDAYTADPLTHPIQDGLNGSRTNWMFEVLPSPNGTWRLGLNVNGGGVNPWPNNRWYLNATLQKNRTYRFEIAIHRTGTSTFRMQARVYDAAGNLLHDDADFANVDESRTFADGTNLRFNHVSYLANFQCGLNGLAGGTADEFPFVVYYQAAFEIRSDRWAGAY